MKRLLLFMLAIFTISCSSDDSNTRQMPEKFDIRVEVKGIRNISLVEISVNSKTEKEWNEQNLPFSGEYTYFVENRNAKSIEISSLAYISKIHEMTEYNLYVDGKLVDSTTITPNPYPGGLARETILKFTYKP